MPIDFRTTRLDPCNTCTVLENHQKQLKSRARSEQSGAREIPCRSRQPTNGAPCVQHRMKDRTFRQATPHNCWAYTQCTATRTHWLLSQQTTTTLALQSHTTETSTRQSQCSVWACPSCRSTSCPFQLHFMDIRTCSLGLLEWVHTTQKFPGCPHSIRDISLVELNVHLGFLSNCNDPFIV